MILPMMIRAMLVGSFAIMLAGTSIAAVPQVASTSRSQIADRSSITFRSAITIEAIQRSNDAVVRKLLKQISVLKNQLAAGKGDTARLRHDLSRAQDETVRRLTETDAQYAAERAAFVRAISSLFEGGDARVLALLHRYADGDSAALAELQENFQRSTASRPQRLIDQRALATLVIDAVRKDERDAREKIEAYEAVLREEPEDYLALSALQGLYLSSGQVDRALAISDRIAAIERDPIFNDAPQIHAGTLWQKSRIALQSGRVDEALNYARQSEAIARAMVAESFAAYRVRHPSDTGPQWVFESFNRDYLAFALRHLREAQRARGDYDSAIISGEEAVALRRLNVRDEIKHAGKLYSAAADYAAEDALQVGNIMFTNRDPQGAMSAYRTALDLAKMGPFEPGKPIDEPHWVLIPMARAAIAAGELDSAEQALTSAHEALQKVTLNAYAVAGEGKYWLQMGNLLQARGRLTEAKGAWVNAEAALGQATSLNRDNKEWRDALDEVEAKLAKAS